MGQRFRILRLVTLAVFLLPLAACHVQRDFHEPTVVTGERLSLHRDTATKQVETKRTDDAFLQKLAADYRQNGNGAIEIDVTYDPNLRGDRAFAAAQATKIAAGLHAHGIDDVTTDTLPASVVRTTGAQCPDAVSQTLVSYQTVKAAVPADCREMGGLDGRPTEFDGDYPLGCTIEAQMAGQIAHPQDLAGRGGLDANSGRRAANVAEGYPHGISNPPLQNTQSATSSSSSQ